MELAYTAVTAVTKWARWQECWAGFKQPSSVQLLHSEHGGAQPLVFTQLLGLGSALTEPQQGTKNRFH